MKRSRIFTILLMAIIAWGCKKPFTPEIVSTNTNYLVVEGVINTGTDSTKIKLSRTTKLADSALTRVETGAIIYVEDNNSGRYSLKEIGNGLYAASLNIKNAQNCRLHIVTAGQKEYVSDFVPVQLTPPIDSIAYTVNGNGLQFNTFTHDQTNKARYFRWEYDETWEYQSHFYSFYKYANGQVQSRLGEDIFHCWISAPSASIILATTSQLSQSIINAQPIAYVDVASGKLGLGYSMLLKEYALTEDAYNYWQKLKKNTEQLGSIFDAQPSDLTGNIHSLSDVKEPVLGYISASNVSTKRFIIGHNAIPLSIPNYYPRPTAAECDSSGAYRIIKIAPLESFSSRLSRVFFKSDSVLISDYGTPGVILGYTYAPAACVDCRVKFLNGTNTRPSFWPVNL